MSRHLERLLQIDHLLRSSRGRTSVSLAQTLEVGDRTIRKELRSSIERLSERLPEQTWIDLQQLADERIIFRLGAQMVNLDPQIWQQLLEACRTSKRVWIRHEVGGHPIPVAICFDASAAPFIRERRWHVTQEIEEHLDGSLTLHLTTSGLNDLKRW